MVFVDQGEDDDGTWVPDHFPSSRFTAGRDGGDFDDMKPSALEQLGSLGGRVLRVGCHGGLSGWGWWSIGRGKKSLPRLGCVG